MVYVCVAVVLDFIAHSFISCGFSGMYADDDVLSKHYHALRYDYSVMGWDWEIALQHRLSFNDFCAIVWQRPFKFFCSLMPKYLFCKLHFYLAASCYDMYITILYSSWCNYNW